MMKIFVVCILYFYITSQVVVGQPSGPLPTEFIPRGLEVNESMLPDQNSSVKKGLVRTSKMETIRKAGDDLRSGAEGLRVGAAKLLGKYPESGSALMLVGALDDKSPLVRRAAIVSLTEQANNGFPIFDRSLLEKVFSKLGDKDVEVRREVSAMIPRLVGGLMRSGMKMVEINGRKVYRSIPASLRPDLYAVAKKAMLDEDAIVRQNMLKYYQYLRIPMSVPTFEKLLNDTDQGVLLAALNRVSVNAREPRVITRIDELSKHPNKGIRLKVIDVARDCNRYDSKYRSILRQMTQYKEP